MDLVEEYVDETQDEARERLTDFFFRVQGSPGILTVLIDRKASMIMTMFTYSLTTITGPSDDACAAAVEHLKNEPEYLALGILERFFKIKSYACGIDNWNRKLAGGSIVQAILSCAAGFDTIKYSDDAQLEPQISKKLGWKQRICGMRNVTNTVDTVVGFVGGIEQDVMKDFALNPVAFQKYFIEILDKKIPCMHFKESMDKMIIYDFNKEDKTRWHQFERTSYNTTNKVNLPCVNIDW